MLRGTRIIEGDEAILYNKIIETCKKVVIGKGYKEIILPSIWEQSTFTDKVGEENSKMMWNFKDKSDRDVCLIPEVTGIIQELYRNEWSKSRKKPIRVFYIQKCYRYEKPQAGRYREFTQFGIELLGGKPEKKIDVLGINPIEADQYDKREVTDLLMSCLHALCPLFGIFREGVVGEGNCYKGINYNFNNSVKRGLSYYVEDGFEVECPELGAQKQIAGGGRYEEGIGWALGVDRLMLLS